MIHITTYKTPNGSTLGAMIEARMGDRVQFMQSFGRKDAAQAPDVLGYLVNEESPHYLGQTGVCHKTETVSIRSWYGISK